MDRACAGHPGLGFIAKDVDARHKTGHDELVERTALKKSR
jgi:hypothetical protein